MMSKELFGKALSRKMLTEKEQRELDAHHHEQAYFWSKTFLRDNYIDLYIGNAIPNIINVLGIDLLDRYMFILHLGNMLYDAEIPETRVYWG